MLIHLRSAVGIMRTITMCGVETRQPSTKLKCMGLLVKTLQNLLAGMVCTIRRLRISGLLIILFMVHWQTRQFQSPKRVIGSEGICQCHTWSIEIFGEFIVKISSFFDTRAQQISKFSLYDSGVWFCVIDLKVDNWTTSRIQSLLCLSQNLWCVCYFSNNNIQNAYLLVIFPCLCCFQVNNWKKYPKTA